MSAGSPQSEDGRDPGSEGMVRAARAAARLARAGDVILLAPAAASMDMFRDYGARGDAFAAAARTVAGGHHHDPGPDRGAGASDAASLALDASAAAPLAKPDGAGRSGVGA